MVAIGHQAALAVEDTSYYSAMVQAERLAAIGQTIATLSHHIKNILQGIRGGSYLIEEGLKDSDNDVVRKGWRIVEKNQEQISQPGDGHAHASARSASPSWLPADLNETRGRRGRADADPGRRRRRAACLCSREPTCRSCYVRSRTCCTGRF